MNCKGKQFIFRTPQFYLHIEISFVLFCILFCFQDAKEFTDPDDTKRKVNEILQKVKGVSGSVNTLNQLDNNPSVPGEENFQEQEERDDSNNQQMVNDTQESLAQNVDATDNLLDSLDNDDINKNGIDCSVKVESNGHSMSDYHSSCSQPLVATSNKESSNTVTVISSSSGNCELMKETVLVQYKEEPTEMINSECDIYAQNGTDDGLETRNISNGEATLVRFLT